MLRVLALLLSAHVLSALALPHAGAQEKSAQEKPVPANPRPLPTEIVGRIGKTDLHARIDVPGFTTDHRSAKLLQQALGARGVLVGAIPESFAMVVLIADKEAGKHLSDLEWRDANLLGSGTRWKYFESDGMPCGETSVQMDGSGSHDFHAFAVRGGYRFDLNLSENLTATHAESLPRERVSRLIQSFRLGLVRLGTWSQMPGSALDRMDQAFGQGEDWKAWLAEQSKASPKDYTIPFARAEILRFRETEPSEQAASYAQAIEILAAKKDLDARGRLVHAASEHGLGLALLDSGENEKATPHFEAALKIARDLTEPVRGRIGYDLARAHARLGHVEQSIACLKEAEAQDPGALRRARTDADFAEVRKSKLFEEMLRSPR